MEQQRRVYQVNLSLHSEGLSTAQGRQGALVFCVCSEWCGLWLSQKCFSNDLGRVLPWAPHAHYWLIRGHLAFLKVKMT